MQGLRPYKTFGCKVCAPTKLLGARFAPLQNFWAQALRPYKITLERSMTQTEKTNIEELKTRIKRLNSKAGQMKMDLHDLAEGLPTDYQTLMDVAQATYDIYRQLDELKQHLKQLEKAT